MDHSVEAIPIEKLRDGIIGYRWRCSCGRERDGIHRTPEKAIEAGHDHINPTGCCCAWGCAIKGEWPEFECYDCPVHKNAFGMADRRCKRHARKVARVD